MSRGANNGRMPYQLDQRFFCHNHVPTIGYSRSGRNYTGSGGNTCNRSASSAHEPADDIAFDLLFIDEKIGDNVDISLTAPPLSL